MVALLSKGDLSPLTVFSGSDSQLIGQGLVLLRQDVGVEARHGQALVPQLLLDVPEVAGVRQQVGGVGVPGMVDRVMQGQPGLFQRLLKADVQRRGGEGPPLPVGEKVVAGAGGLPPGPGLDFNVRLQGVGQGAVEIDVPEFAALPLPHHQPGFLPGQVDVPDLEGGNLAHPEAAPQGQGHQHMAGHPGLPPLEQVQVGQFLAGLQEPLDLIGGHELLPGDLVVGHGFPPWLFLINYILILRKYIEKRGGRGIIFKIIPIFLKIVGPGRVGSAFPRIRGRSQLRSTVTPSMQFDDSVLPMSTIFLSVVKSWGDWFSKSCWRPLLSAKDSINHTVERGRWVF